jgi:ribose transport system substrate-binding protein
MKSPLCLIGTDLRKMSRTRSLVLSLVLPAILLGCNSRQENGYEEAGSAVHTVPQGTQLKLALLPNAPTAFWNLAVQGLKRFEKETGIHVEIKYPPNGKVEEQNQILEDLISQGYHGVAMSVIAPDDQIREINRALERLNVTAVDSDAPRSRRIAFVGPKQYDAGKAAGQEVVKLLPQGGAIACFVGDLTAENAVQRIRGIKEVIGGHNIEIVAMKEDGKDRTKAREQVEDVITVFPEISLLVGLWSYNGPAIRDALRASGKAGRIKVVAFDEEEGTLQGIEEGLIEASVALSPFDYGYLSAKLLRDLAFKGEAARPSGGTIDTGFTVVNRANLAAFRQQLREEASW